MFQVVKVLNVKLKIINDIVVAGCEETTSSTGRIADRFIRLWTQNFDYGPHQRARSKVMASMISSIPGVFFQESFVNVR